MKKSMFSFLVFLISISNIWGQYNIKWGKLSTSESKVYRPYIFGEDKESIYLISYERDDVMLEKIDKSSWHKDYSKKIEVKPQDYYDHNLEAAGLKGQEKVLEHITFLSKQFIVFSSDFDKDNNTYTLYASIYDAKTGEKKKVHIKLYEVQVEKFKRKGSFGFLASKNREYMLIHHFAYHKKKKEYTTHNLVIDNNLEILTDKKETVSREENTYNIYNYILDDEGSFYFAKRLDASETYIVSYDANKDYEKWEEKIDLDELKTGYGLNNITFEINDKNDLLISGFYVADHDRLPLTFGAGVGDLKGCFFMKLDNFSKEMTINKISEFNDEFFEHFKTKKEKKRGKAPLIPSLYNNTQILIKKDGGIVLIGENYRSIFYSAGLRSTTVHHFADIIVVNLTANGEILWSKRVKKNQAYAAMMLKSAEKTVSHMKYFSYLAGLSKDKLYIMYNELPDNIGKEMYEDYNYMKGIKSAVPIKTVIDLKSGEEKLEIIEELKQDKLYFKPMEHFQARQGADIIMLAQNKKMYKFGILSFE